MKRLLAIAVLVLLYATALPAQTVSFSVMIPPNRMNREGLSDGATANLSVFLTKRWGIEASAATHSTYQRRQTFDYNEQVEETFVNYHTVQVRTMPVDLRALFQLRPDNPRWRPFIGLGVHYVERPHDIHAPEAAAFSPQLTAGTMLKLTPKLGLRFEGRLLLRSETAQWDRGFHALTGVSWGF